MRKIRALAIAASTFLVSSIVLAGGSICPASNAVGVEGIGDGCSTSIAGYIFPDIAIFKSTFTSSCNAHDKCYSTLGTTYGECNGRFLSDMRSACRSKFNPFFFPGEYSACYASANHYYAGVEAWGSIADPLPGIQSEALSRSRQMQAQVDGNVCGTTPEATTLYSAGLISQINNTFSTYAGRLPTVYEFLDAVNAGNIVADRNSWNATLISKAGFAASVQPPLVSYTKSQTDTRLLLAINPTQPGASYFWKASGTASGPTWEIPMRMPKYDTSWALEGFVKATSSTGVRNMQVIDIKVFERGWCSSRPGIACY